MEVLITLTLIALFSGVLGYQTARLVDRIRIMQFVALAKRISKAQSDDQRKRIEELGRRL